MPAHYARAAFRATDNSSGTLYVNVFHFEIDTLSDPPNWSSVATDIGTRFATLWRAILYAGTTCQDVTVTAETYPGSDLGQGVYNVNGAGTRTIADSGLSTALCAVTTWKSATTKRYARGRTFWPPAMATNQATSGGTWNAAQSMMTAIDAFATSYLATWTVGSTTYSPIVFSRSRVLKSESPFIFAITGKSQGLRQHFLRSRLTAP